MPDQTTEATSPPATAPAVQSSDDQNKGPDNQTVLQYAKRFLQPDAAPAESKAEPAELKVPEDKTPAEDTATETAPADSTEAETEVPVDGKKTEAETKEKADEALSKSTSQIEFTPEQQAVFDKRLGKEVAKRKELERQLEEVKSKVVEPAPLPEVKPEALPIMPLPSGVAPLANINDINGLIELQQQAKEAIRFAEDALANEADGEPLPEGYNRKILRDVVRNAKLTVEDHIPQRAQFLQNRNQIQQTAYELLPFLKDKTDPNFVLAQSFRKANPWLQNIPAGDLIIGMYIKGIEAVKAEREAAGKAKAKPAIEKKPTPKPVGAQTEVSVDAAPIRTTLDSQSRQALKREQERLNAKGGVTVNEFARYLANQEILKTR